MEFLIVLAAVAGIAFVIISYIKTEERKKAIIAEAATLGLTYTPETPFDIDDLDFGLFRKGDGRDTDHCMSGTWNGLNVFVFGYWYYDESTSVDSKGHVTTSRDYSHFTCSLTSFPLAAPATSIGVEGLFSGVARVFGVKDLQFESEDFNKRRKVHSDDPKFASYLIDARMMDYLLRIGDWCFDLSGTSLLVTLNSKFAPGSAPDALAATTSFLEQVPSVVRDVYGRENK